VRNRLFKLIIEKVELRHDTKTIYATLYWKTGFCQRVIIQRAKATSMQGSLWTEQENKLLEKVWREGSLKAVMEALSERTLLAIRNRARRLGLKRQRKTNSARTRRRWTEAEEAQAQELCEAGTPLAEISITLNRTQAAVIQRATAKKWHVPSQAVRKKRPVIWRMADQDFKVLEEAPSQILSPS
jgi:peptidyl-tRNA hydrolase